jgi:hypothetical protein
MTALPSEDESAEIAVIKDDKELITERIISIKNRTFFLSARYDSVHAYCKDTLKRDIAKTCLRAGIKITDDQLFSLEMALTEVIPNTAEHGLHYDSKEKMQISFSATRTVGHAYFGYEVCGGKTRLDRECFKINDYPTMVEQGNIAGTMTEGSEHLRIGCFLSATLADVLYLSEYPQNPENVTSTAAIVKLR